MSRWLVRLEGERFDLEEFPRWFPDGDIYSLEEDGLVYLAGPALERFDDAGRVREVALGALDRMFAVATLLEANLRRPEIHSVVHEADDGARNITSFLAATVCARSKMRAEGTVVGAEPGASRPTQAQELLASAGRNAHLDYTLSIWSDPHITWPRLYRILEELESALGMTVHKAGLCTKSQRERFRRSANAADISGLDSRHGAGRCKSPPNPMTLEAARDFMADLTRRVLGRFT